MWHAISHAPTAVETPGGVTVICSNKTGRWRMICRNMRMPETQTR